MGLSRDGRSQRHAPLSHCHRRPVPRRAEREALRDAVHLRTDQARPEHSAASANRIGKTSHPVREPAMSKPLPPGIHAILGDSAAGTFMHVFEGASERLLIDQDVLSVGPTRSCASWMEWQRMRFNWWNGLIPDTISEHVHSPSNL